MTDLATRTGLPDHLRVLARLYPRATWTGHANFDEMTRFWLDRHLMFREVMRRLQNDTEAFLDQNEDARMYQQRLARLASFFLNQLHGHHMIEDQHYFPQMQALEPRLSAGFDLLHSDHEALDTQIDRLETLGNAVLRADPAALATAAGRVRDQLTGFERFLDRHLADEEELIVPVILEHGPRLHG